MMAAVLRALGGSGAVVTEVGGGGCVTGEGGEGPGSDGVTEEN